MILRRRRSGGDVAGCLDQLVAARRACGTCAVRPRRPVHVPEPQGDHPPVRRDGSRVPAHVAAAAIPGALAPTDLRNHRKLLVVDGVVGFTGSQNLIIDHYHKKKTIKQGLHWHELMVRLTGPIVRELDAVFVTDWYSETDELLPLDTSPVRPEDDIGLVDAQILPSGPSFDNDNNLKLFAAMIHNARQRISVTSPYYVPDETIQMALVTAGSRGLDVELFVSEIGDQFMVFHAQRSYYEQLLRAGVTIDLYRAPTILHAKHLSIDDDVAVIGSSNLDIRSLSLHMELSVLVHGAKFTAAMRAVEDDYRSKSRQVVLQDWLRRPTRERIFDNLMRLTSSLQ